jgi:hypothetical protein
VESVTSRWPSLIMTFTPYQETAPEPISGVKTHEVFDKHGCYSSSRTISMSNWYSKTSIFMISISLLPLNHAHLAPPSKMRLSSVTKAPSSSSTKWSPPSYLRTFQSPGTSQRHADSNFGDAASVVDSANPFSAIPSLFPRQKKSRGESCPLLKKCRKDDQKIKERTRARSS